MLRVQKFLGGRRFYAVTAMVAALLLLLFIPLWLTISIILTNLDSVGDLVRALFSLRAPRPPEWLSALPVVGAPFTSAWGKLYDAGLQDLAPKLTPYAGALTKWMASLVGSLGSVLVHFILTVLLCAVMYSAGERAAASVVMFGRRLGEDRGEMVVRLAGQAIRSVALGVVVTAFAQTVIAGLGLVVVGAPFAGMMTAVIFGLCLIQLGPSLVLFPVVIWMYYSGESLGATVLLVFTIVATTIDQVIRPILIRRGADLPLLLILAGVIGGLIAFGVVGMFIGPTLLAVAYTLLKAWIFEVRDQDGVTGDV
jgi:predicted PurR-regulated permease PerM